MNRIVRKAARFASLLIAVCLLASFAAMTASAANATAYTYALASDGSWVQTQDAYLVGSILLRDLGLSKPQDLAVDGDTLYIADTGNSRVVVYNRDTQESRFLQLEQFNEITGLYVKDDTLYVADYGARQIYMMNKYTGELLRTYTRPETAIYGANTTFLPRKLTVASDGAMYVVSEGSYDGIVQLSPEGEFLGYFGHNNVSYTFTEQLQDLFFTEAQKQKLFNRVPKSFYNLTSDSEGLIYSVTKGVDGDPIKKHNIAGYNMLDSVIGEQNFEDVAVGAEGQILCITSTGLIYEYSTDGELLFSLGGRVISAERGGLFTVVTALDVDDYGAFYVLDAEQAVVHFFYPTEFALQTHQAMALYNKGQYEQSLALWQDLLRQSGNSRLAHNGIAKCYVQMQDFEQAASHYKIAENRDGYSESYWEIRNVQLQTILPFIGIAILLLLFLPPILHRLRRKKVPAADAPVKPKRHYPKVVDDLLFSFKFIKHPFDSYYSVRHEGRGNYISSTLLYALAFGMFMLSTFGSGFIFNYHNVRNTSVLLMALLFLIPLFLAIICNFMVIEINDGEARFKDIYHTAAYGLVPYIIISPFVTLLSHVVTYNESFLLSFVMGFVYCWCAVLIVIGLREANDYEYGQVIVNLIITVFLMCMVILVVSMIYMFWSQLSDFVYNVIREVTNHVG